MGGRWLLKDEFPDSGWYRGSPPSNEVRAWCLDLNCDVVAVQAALQRPTEEKRVEEGAAAMVGGWRVVDEILESMTS